MQPVHCPMTTMVLGAPAGWDKEKRGECFGLPVVKHDGMFYSYWKPTFRECLALLFGRTVRLCIVGAGHPPVALSVSNEHGGEGS